MNTHEQFITPKTARLAREAGFDWKCNHYYFTQNGKTELKSDFRHPAQNYNESMATLDSKSFEFEVCSCPTQSVLQRWLREIHHLHITIFSSSQESWMFRITGPHHQLEDVIYGEDFSTYESALEEAEQECLTLLIKNL